MPSGGPRNTRVNTEAKSVSGPGKLSQRTDMIPSGGAYGDRKAMVNQIADGNRATPASPKPSPLSELFAPTNNTSEPVTAGNPLGDGPGAEVLNLPAVTYNPINTLSRLAQSDPSGNIELILQDLQARGL